MHRSALCALLGAAAMLGLVACEPPDEAPPEEPFDPCNPDIPGLMPEWELAEPVEVLYDGMGVPHVYAQSDQDLFYASGYLIAEQRLFQMDILRRASQGTLAEIVGEAGVESDVQARTFDFDRYSCEILLEHAEEGVDELNAAAAYLSGINAYVDEVLSGEAPMPAEFTALDYEPSPFAREDMVAMGLRINFAFSNSLFFDLFYTVYEELAPAADDPDVPVFVQATPTYIMVDEPPAGGSGGRGDPDDGAAKIDADASVEDLLALLDWGMRFQDHWGWNKGSNNWAVRGDFTDSGRPIIAGDPHSFLADPSYMTLQHLNSADAGGSYDVAGFSFAGTAGVHLGHNRDLVWTATTNFADAVDLWDVEIDGDRAKIGDEWVEITTTQETIRIRQEDGTLKEQILNHQVVGDHGVIVPEAMLPLPVQLFANDHLMMRWTGFTPTSGLMLYLDMNRAEDLADFEAAIDYQKSGIQNWVGATADGIRYKTHGLVPERPSPTPPAYRVMDGSDPDTYWTGWLGPEVMPYLDEAEPYIATANNDPWGHTDDNDPLNDAFYYGSWYAAGFRAGQIEEALDAAVADGGITVDDMIALQWDQTSDAARRMVPLLEAAAAEIPTNPALAEYVDRPEIAAAVAQLAAWDRVMTREAHEPALFRTWFTLLTRHVLGDDLTLLFDAIEEIQVMMLDKVLILAFERQVDSVIDGDPAVLMIEALDQALAFLDERAAALGKAEVSWGDQHVFSFDTDYVTYFDMPFGGTSEIAAGGDGTSINVAECHYWDGSDLRERCVGDHGPIFRAVASFDEDGTPRYRYNWPHGHDGDAAHWAEGHYTLLPFHRQEVEADSSETRILSP